MTKSKKSTVKTVTIMIVLAGIIFCAFMYFMNREDAESVSGTEQTEVEKLLAKDFSKEYPPTAREVMKRYARILKCIYSGEVSTDEVAQLGELILGLYSEELLAANPYESYMKELQNEVEEYSEANRVVISYMVDSGDNTITWTKDGIDYSRILATFTTQEDTIFNKSSEEFVLKLDEEGRWKIVGWRIVDKEDL